MNVEELSAKRAINMENSDKGKPVQRYLGCKVPSKYLIPALQELLALCVHSRKRASGAPVGCPCLDFRGSGDFLLISEAFLPIMELLLRVTYRHNCSVSENLGASSCSRSYPLVLLVQRVRLGIGRSQCGERVRTRLVTIRKHAVVFFLLRWGLVCRSPSHDSLLQPLEFRIDAFHKLAERTQAFCWDDSELLVQAHGCSHVCNEMRKRIWHGLDVLLRMDVLSEINLKTAQTASHSQNM